MYAIPAGGGTLEWSSPETVLRQPVSASSDGFSVALMAVALLDGMMYGAVTEHVIALQVCL